MSRLPRSRREIEFDIEIALSSVFDTRCPFTGYLTDAAEIDEVVQELQEELDWANQLEDEAEQRAEAQADFFELVEAVKHMHADVRDYQKGLDQW